MKNVATVIRHGYSYRCRLHVWKYPVPDWYCHAYTGKEHPTHDGSLVVTIMITSLLLMKVTYT